MRILLGRIAFQFVTSAALLWGAIFLSATTWAEEEPAASEELPCHRVVFRISDTVLNSLMDQRHIDREVDVQDVILGTSVSGKARIVGNTFVKPTESSEQAAFVIHFNGVVHARTVGYNGPAVLHNVAVTHFTATKRVVFAPGKGFRGLEPRVVAKTECTLEGVDSTRGGLIGRMVRRRAEQAATEQKPLATEIARQRAEKRIKAAFEKNSEERLANLNRRADVKSLAIALTGNGTDDPQYVCCTTPRYVQIATRFGGGNEGTGNEAIQLPVLDTPHSTGAPIEIWVHESLMKTRLMSSLDLIGEKIRTSDLALATAAALRLLGQSDEQVATQQPIRVHNLRDWRVVEIETPVSGVRGVASKTPAPSKADVASRVSETDIVKALKPIFPDLAPNLAADRSKINSRERANPNPVARTTPRPRTWTSGKYTAEAEFVALDGSTVRLLRTNGKRAQIELEKLSSADQQWIKDYLAAN